MNVFKSPQAIGTLCATYFDDKRETLVGIRRAIIQLRNWDNGRSN